MNAQQSLTLARGHVASAFIAELFRSLRWRAKRLLGREVVPQPPADGAHLRTLFRPVAQSGPLCSGILSV